MKNLDEVMSYLNKFVNDAVSSESEKLKIQKQILKLRDEQVNIMIVGGTGVGKSSTINALFDVTDARVGVGVDPETISIDRYEMGNLILWDTPGLGHGLKEDKKHRKNIVEKLTETVSDSDHLLIDLVLVIVDASNRDMGTSYELIDLIINSYAHKDRIIIALNQADMAMKGRFWNSDENRPEPQLVEFLNNKVESIKRRIKNTNGLDIEPVYYSAGYTDGKEKQAPYNISKLFYLIASNLKSDKAMIVCSRQSKDERNFRYDENNDRGESYFNKTKDLVVDFVKGTFETVTSAFSSVVSSVCSFFSSWW